MNKIMQNPNTRWVSLVALIVGAFAILSWTAIQLVRVAAAQATQPPVVHSGALWENGPWEEAPNAVPEVTISVSGAASLTIVITDVERLDPHRQTDGFTIRLGEQVESFNRFSPGVVTQTESLALEYKVTQPVSLTIRSTKEAADPSVDAFAGESLWYHVVINYDAEPTPTSTSTNTATPTDTATATGTDTPTATPSLTATVPPTDTVTLTPTPTESATVTATDTPSVTPSATESATVTASPSASPTASATVTPTESETPQPPCRQHVK